MTKDQLRCYWIETSEHDFHAMQQMCAAGNGAWTLYIAHLVIEKLLKACCVKTVGRDVPRSHNLLALAETAGLDVDEEKEDLLRRLTQFNVQTRYPDWQQEFYKIADRDYTAHYVEEVKGLRQWLLEVLSEQSNPS